MLLAALRCEKGDITGNLAAQLRLLADARSAGCQLAVFPEMSLTGSADPATHPERLITLDHPAVGRLARASGETGVAVCFGLAERSPAGQPYITQAVAASGRLLGVQRKRRLGEGEEAFIAATGTGVFGLAGVSFGVAICAEAGFDAPFDDAAAGGAGLMLFPAAPGPAWAAHRRGILAARVRLVGDLQPGRCRPARPAAGTVGRAGRPGGRHRRRGLPGPGRCGRTGRQRDRPAARLAGRRPGRRHRRACALAPRRRRPVPRTT